MPQFTVEELRAAIGDPNKPEDVKRLGEFITSHDDTFAHGLAFILNSLDEATLQQKLSLEREKLAQATAITDQEESDKIIKELQDKLTEATSQLNTTPPAPAQTVRSPQLPDPLRFGANRKSPEDLRNYLFDINVKLRRNAD